MQTLLARKDIITILNVGSPTSVSKLSTKEILKRMQEEIVHRQKYRSHQVNLYMTQCQPENKIIENILIKHQSENNIASVRVKENLKSQENIDLEQRIEERKKRSESPAKGITRALSINSFRM